MTTPTAGEVNRRIAEFCFEAVHEMEPGGVLRGLDAGIWDKVPDYMHDAGAVIAAVEKLCRERKTFFEFMYDGEEADDPQWALVIGAEMMDVKHKCFATAAALALFAVLDTEPKPERTEP